MPAPSLKSLARDVGVSARRAAELWEKAKEVTTKQGISEGTDQYYAYTTGVVKRMLGHKIKPAGRDTAPHNNKEAAVMTAPTPAQPKITLRGGSIILSTSGDLSIVAKSGLEEAKADNGRAAFLRPFMKQVSGDFGQQLVAAFTSGDKATFVDLWGQVSASMVAAMGGETANVDVANVEIAFNTFSPDQKTRMLESWRNMITGVHDELNIRGAVKPEFMARLDKMTDTFLSMAGATGPAAESASTMTSFAERARQIIAERAGTTPTKPDYAARAREIVAERAGVETAKGKGSATAKGQIKFYSKGKGGYFYGDADGSTQEEQDAIEADRQAKATPAKGKGYTKHSDGTIRNGAGMVKGRFTDAKGKPIKSDDDEPGADNPKSKSLKDDMTQYGKAKAAGKNDAKTKALGAKIGKIRNAIRKSSGGGTDTASIAEVVPGVTPEIAARAAELAESFANREHAKGKAAPKTQDDGDEREERLAQEDENGPRQSPSSKGGKFKFKNKRGGRAMAGAETAAEGTDAWWAALTAVEQASFIEAHPRCRFAKEAASSTRLFGAETATTQGKTKQEDGSTYYSNKDDAVAQAKRDKTPLDKVAYSHREGATRWYVVKDDAYLKREKDFHDKEDAEDKAESDADYRRTGRRRSNLHREGL